LNRDGARTPLICVNGPIAGSNAARESWFRERPEH